MLIKCPECGKEMSDKASQCPNCGVPTEIAINIINERKQKEAGELAERKYSSQAGVRDSYKANPIAVWNVLLFVFGSILLCLNVLRPGESEP